MKVWVFVEGKSDVQALSALWRGWRQRLHDRLARRKDRRIWVLNDGILLLNANPTSNYRRLFRFIVTCAFLTLDKRPFLLQALEDAGVFG